MGVTPLTFTGTSTYASDFQSILTRAVNIANVPLEQLENSDETALSKKTQLGSLGSAMTSLTSAVQSLGSLGASGAITAFSSNSQTVSVTAHGATSAASYTVNSVTSLATAASETSVTGYSDSSSQPVSANGSLSLVVGTASYPIQLSAANNNLVGLQNAINSLNAGVTASILTTGNGNFLSVSANAPGATTLRLMDDPAGANTDILTSANQGTNAVFQLNNLTVTRSENTVNDLIPGASLTLVAKSTSPTTLTLASDPNQIGSSIQSLVTAYNAVVDQVNAQTGKAAGLLQGDSVLLQVQSALRSLTTFQASGDVKNLADLGITLGPDGKMTFDQSSLSSFSSAQVSAALQFLGSSSSGIGGLAQQLSAISDPVSGAIANEESSLTEEDGKLQVQITNTANSINSMQQTLLQQLSQSDSLITSLTSQQNMLTASVQSLNYVMYGKQNNS